MHTFVMIYTFIFVPTTFVLHIYVIQNLYILLSGNWIDSVGTLYIHQLMKIQFASEYSWNTKIIFLVKNK